MLHEYATGPAESAHPELWDGLIASWDCRSGVLREYRQPPQPSLLSCLIVLAVLMELFMTGKDQ